MMHLQKLTRSYNGHEHFTHRVAFETYGGGEARDKKIRAWIGLRNWLWGRFGPSAEQYLARAELLGSAPKWAWDSEKSAIYLRDEALTEFLLIKDRWQ